MLVTGNPEATAELERLIEVGQERGSLSTGEVAEILQETGLDPTQLEDAYRELEAHGVDLRDEPRRPRRPSSLSSGSRSRAPPIRWSAFSRRSAATRC